MTIEQVRLVFDAKPFRPFIIHLTDGRKVPVLRREFIMADSSGRMLVVCQPDDSLDYINLPSVADLEPQAAQ
jgi:hypothetical protein